MRYFNIISLIFLGCIGRVHAQEPLPLTILFSDSSAYISHEKAVTSGIIYDYMEKMAVDQNLKVDYAPHSLRERLKILSGPRKNICSFGMRKTPEREKMFRFSDKMGWGPTNALIVGYGMPNLRGYKTLEEAMKAENLTISRLEGTTFSSDINKLIDTYDIPAVSSSQTRTARLLNHNPRLGYLISTAFSSQVLLLEQANGLKIYSHFDEFDVQVDYYAMCTKNTPDETINRLNAGIRSIGTLALEP